ncbi:MAG: serine/threonine-protein kinase [Minicystis sp.]
MPGPLEDDRPDVAPCYLHGALKPTEAHHRLRAGSYLLEGEIARGGFGVVHRARHAVNATPAAVKVLHEAWSGDRVALTRFAREAEVVISIAHPHLVEIFEHGRLDDGRPYFAMELLHGSTLADHLAARGRMPVEETIGILDPIAAALDAAHARGIVHRDVKPSNVFLAEERPKGRVVLLDFGLAKLRDARAGTLTGSRDTLGTVLYMAPEQLLGSRVDARADVYALGALAYAMLTGQPPFGTSVGTALRQVRRSARPAEPSSAAPVDPALDAPILRALDRDAEQRFASAGEFVASLRAAASAREQPRPLAGRPALAVHAEVRGGEEDDESCLADLEAALPTVSAALSALGLVAVVETAMRLLLIDWSSNDPARARRVLDAAVEAHRRFTADPRGSVSLAIAIHAGQIPVSPEGTLLGGGLLDVASWLPAAPAGVIASRAALAGIDIDAEPVPGAADFCWIAR